MPVQLLWSAQTCLFRDRISVLFALVFPVSAHIDAPVWSENSLEIHGVILSACECGSEGKAQREGVVFVPAKAHPDIGKPWFVALDDARENAFDFRYIAHVVCAAQVGEIGHAVVLGNDARPLPCVQKAHKVPENGVLQGLHVRSPQIPVLRGFAGHAADTFEKACAFHGKLFPGSCPGSVGLCAHPAQDYGQLVFCVADLAFSLVVSDKGEADKAPVLPKLNPAHRAVLCGYDHGRCLGLPLAVQIKDKGLYAIEAKGRVGAQCARIGYGKRKLRLFPVPGKREISKAPLSLFLAHGQKGVWCRSWFCLDLWGKWRGHGCSLHRDFLTWNRNLCLPVEPLHSDDGKNRKESAPYQKDLGHVGCKAFADQRALQCTMRYGQGTMQGIEFRSGKDL